MPRLFVSAVMLGLAIPGAGLAADGGAAGGTINVSGFVQGSCRSGPPTGEPTCNAPLTILTSQASGGGASPAATPARILVTPQL